MANAINKSQQKPAQRKTRMKKMDLRVFVKTKF